MEEREEEGGREGGICSAHLVEESVETTNLYNRSFCDDSKVSECRGLRILLHSNNWQMESRFQLGRERGGRERERGGGGENSPPCFGHRINNQLTSGWVT